MIRRIRFFRKGKSNFSRSKKVTVNVKHSNSKRTVYGKPYAKEFKLRRA